MKGTSIICPTVEVEKTKHKVVKRLSQSHLVSLRAIQILCLLQAMLLDLNTCLDLRIRFDIGLIAKKRQALCFYPLPSCSDQFAWRLQIALRLQLKTSKQLVCSPLSFPNSGDFNSSIATS